MSEFTPQVPEKPSEHVEALLTAPEQVKTLPTAEQAEPLRAGETDPVEQLEAAGSTIEQEQPVSEQAEPAQQLEAARQTVEQEQPTSEQADPLQRLQAAEKAAEPAAPTFVNADLKKVTLQREIQAIRRKLPATQRALSRVVHQPVVRAISEVTGKTASRPSGLLGGGLVAFLGSAVYLYMTKHVGFSYNYFVFLLLFVGGFGIGLALELVVWALTARRRSN